MTFKLLNTKESKRHILGILNFHQRQHCKNLQVCTFSFYDNIMKK